MSDVRDTDTGLHVADNLSQTSDLYFDPLETRRPTSVIQTVGGTDTRNCGTLRQHELSFRGPPREWQCAGLR